MPLLYDIPDNSRSASERQRKVSGDVRCDCGIDSPHSLSMTNQKNHIIPKLALSNTQ